MIKNKIIVQLKGGIGNQMFQYAFAKTFALKRNCELYLDTYTGFISDHTFNRKYELKHLNLNDKKAPLSLILIYYLSKFDLILRYRNKNKYLFTRPYATFLFELDHKFNEQYLNINFNGLLFVNGYWQSPKYFYEYKHQINQNFDFKIKLSNHIITLANQISKENSIAICLRLYEEVSNPGLLSITGKQKSINELSNQINYILNLFIDTKVYIFCTHKPDFVNQLALPNSTTFITADSSYNSSIETLFLLKHCKYFLIMNSSFYWWGAYLSKSSELENSIFADSNFLNQDIYPENWIKF